MRSHRFLSAIIILLAIVGAFYVAIGLFVPSPRQITVGVDKKSGRVRQVEQGIVFLPWHRYFRLAFDRRDGLAQSDGMVRIVSSEGVPLTMNYRIRFDVSSERIPDADKLVADGWSAWLRARVGEVLTAMARQIPIEQLVSPASDFHRQREAIQRAVTAHLARSGLDVKAFAIQRIDYEKNAFLQYKRTQLRQQGPGPRGRVAVIGIEGADWDLVTDLVRDGRLPNIAALIENGSSADLRTLQPTVAPLLWTTAATGLSPDRHGVVSFRSAGEGPVTSAERYQPALWDIATAFGRQAVTVGWWTAWPPSSETVVFDTPVSLTPAAVYPASLQERIASLVIPPSAIEHEQVARFMGVSESEFAAAASDPSHPITAFRSILAKTWTDHRVAVELYRAVDPMLLMLLFDGPDGVGHLFGPYHASYWSGGSEERRRYWATVARYYQEIDRLIGEWTKVLPKETTLLLVSGHGMHWGSRRPEAPPAGSNALIAHRDPGILIASGNLVTPRTSRSRPEVSIYDVAPTVLAILGLPPAREMTGRAATSIVAAEPVAAVDVISYADLIERNSFPSEAAIDADAYKSGLARIGHVTGDRTENAADADDATEALTPEQSREYALRVNEGVRLAGEGKRRDAAAAFSAAIDIAPRRPAAWINLVKILGDLQQFTNAEQLLVRAAEQQVPGSEQMLLDFAAYLRDNDMPTRAIRVLEKGRELRPDSFEIASNLGSSLAAANRYTDALPELERALALKPTSSAVLNNLGLIYVKRQDYGRALDYWNRSLALEPNQPEIRAGVAAVQSRL